jgi:excinuclease ABC subunit C
MKFNDSISNSKLITTLPNKPGIYKFYDKNNEILYVGKAKSIKNRVLSYFNGRNEGRLKILVQKIQRIEHFVVDTEAEALLLENNLIKQLQPRYNVQLKDDKTYPWICINNEHFPRVYMTRQGHHQENEYFGPYVSAHSAKILLELIRKLYPLRTCKYNLTRENITRNKFKVCLEYHIGNCKGPCESLQDEEDYNANIENIRKILKGSLTEIIQYIRRLMQSYADDRNFEAAAEMKNKLQLLNNYKSKSKVVNPKINNIDVFSIINFEGNAYVNYLRILNGSVIQIQTIDISKKIEESIEDLLSLAVVDIRQKMNSNSSEIVVPFVLNDIKGVDKITVPKQGDKLKLLELSERNLKFYVKEKEEKKLKYDKHVKNERRLNQIKVDLKLEVLPYHIECFDNSNIQGASPVAACVVFRNGRPSKKEYRHYHIKTVIGPDDYASMKEVVYKRYSRLIKEKTDLPQLVIIDGGKGQLNAALQSLAKLKISNKIRVIGLAKRLEEIYLENDPVPLYLDKTSYTLRVLQHARDEAHRFGITFHRKIRTRQGLENELLKIPGLGQKSVDALLIRFKSVSNIRNANYDDIEDIIGTKRAQLLINYFDSKL